MPYILIMGAFIFVQIRLTDKHQAKLDAIAAYLYIRWTLRTDVSFEEANDISWLFSGNAGKWYPLLQVRDLPKEQRKAYLFDFANKPNRF